MMKAAVVQLDAATAQPEANLALVSRWVRRAADLGCDLVVLPEMMDTGYVMADIERTADAWDGSFVPALQDVARDCGVNVVCGASERADGDLFNAVAVIDRGGAVVGHYRKVHLFSPAGEDRTCTAGSSLVACVLDGVKWGVAVCYDVRFPEMMRRLVFDGAQGILVPSAFPFPRLDHWRVLLRARAIESQCFVVAANRVGTDGQLTFCGSSQIIDPYGTVLASTGEIGDAVATADLDFDNLSAVRSAIPALSSTRPDVYAGEVREDATAARRLTSPHMVEAHG